MQNNSFLANLFRGIYKKIQQIISVKNKKAGLSWLNEILLKHEKTGITRKYNYKGNKIYYSNPTEFLHTFKELFIHEIYKTTFSPGSYIIDCGGNIGLSTIYFKKICPTAEVLVFEPDEKNFEILVKNIDSFRLKQVTAKKEAVWIEDTNISFTNDGTMGSKIETNTEINTLKVKACRLLNYIEREVAFLKIDIEGAEYKVLKDICPGLSKVKNMFLEYHGTFDQIHELTEIFQIIQQAGFRYYIKEAAEIYKSPFLAGTNYQRPTYDVQLNIFCFR